jgi:hypothetical protein
VWETSVFTSMMPPLATSFLSNLIRGFTSAMWSSRPRSMLSRVN